jgi:hypothetical protein
MCSEKLLKGYHVTSFIIIRVVYIYKYNTQLKYVMTCNKCNKCVLLQKAV